MLENTENIKMVDLHYVDPKDPMEVMYLHSMYPWISKEDIKSVIEKQGPERKHIEHCLDGYHS